MLENKYPETYKFEGLACIISKYGHTEKNFISKIQLTLLWNIADRIREIQTLFAFDQFCNGKFKESMDVFYKLDIDPSHVIGLYSDLLPSEFCNQVHP